MTNVVQQTRLEQWNEMVRRRNRRAFEIVSSNDVNEFYVRNGETNLQFVHIVTMTLNRLKKAGVTPSDPPTKLLEADARIDVAECIARHVKAMQEHKNYNHKKHADELVAKRVMMLPNYIKKWQLFGSANGDVTNE